MKITIYVKQVPDTKNGAAFDSDGMPNRAAILAIMNPDDKTGLEVTLRLKDELDARVTILTMGFPKTIGILREAYMVGADKMILVTDHVFGSADTWATSSTITTAFRNLEYDLIITGCQVIDGDITQVSPQITERLDLSVVSYTQDLKISGDYAIVQRQFEGRYHVLKVRLPCLCAALAKLNPPRYITTGHLFNAFDQDVTTWGRKDLPTLENKNMGLMGSPTKVARAPDKVEEDKGVKANLDVQESVGYLTDRLVGRHAI